jgi:hypothetical protein
MQKVAFLIFSTTTVKFKSRCFPIERSFISRNIMRRAVGRRCGTPYRFSPTRRQPSAKNISWCDMISEQRNSMSKMTTGSTASSTVTADADADTEEEDK